MSVSCSLDFCFFSLRAETSSASILSSDKTGKRGRSFIYRYPIVVSSEIYGLDRYGCRARRCRDMEAIHSLENLKPDLEGLEYRQKNRNTDFQVDVAAI